MPNYTQSKSCLFSNDRFPPTGTHIRPCLYGPLRPSTPIPKLDHTQCEPVEYKKLHNEDFHQILRAVGPTVHLVEPTLPTIWEETSYLTLISYHDELILSRIELISSRIELISSHTCSRYELSFG